ncbi:MAG: cation diffusion facilitator family transporter [Candidatus Methanoperedens sp.]|nr:cation diffusion facilitator family transporter [Candidatus Methanoperedens sp.]MCZ7370137.1 cation diffusion facilitator family transporter [Candidatus Methanoperedens sp.]
MEDIHKNLKIAVILTAIIFIIELWGGIISNSLALLSDAAHVFMDVVSLVLAYGALKISVRPSNRNVTFGYHRFEIFAALINGLTIVMIAVFIFYEAYGRIFNPPQVKGVQVLVIATIGLIVNTWAALKLHGHHDLNVRGAYLHVIGDALASVAVIGGAIVIILTGKTFIDPVLSILIGIMLFYGAFRLIFGSVRILLEFAPTHVDADTLKEIMMQLEGVKGVHDIHIWSICSNIHAMSAHVLVDRIHVQQTEALISEINKIVRDDFRILHTTLQFECAECVQIEIGHESYHE